MQKYRARLSSQVSAIRTAIVPQIRTAGAAPVRVKLLSQAAAKSHRPEHLFSPQSCPIVGGGGLGELFVKATPEGLDRLDDDHRAQHVRPMTKELSCVETIEPVTPSIGAAALTPPMCFAAARAESTASSRAWGCSISARIATSRSLSRILKARAEQRDIASEHAGIFAVQLHL